MTISEKELTEMETKSHLNDEYNCLAWGSKDDIQILIKEIRRLNKELIKGVEND